jgi:hypothetical protein
VFKNSRVVSATTRKGPSLFASRRDRARAHAWSTAGLRAERECDVIYKIEGVVEMLRMRPYHEVICHLNI